ncbi:hypothetical protein TNCV_4064201 [Trichonephila clavipes]|nr:hypothetical protein TNCV_4064201 [Trichonephila clavipes]
MKFHPILSAPQEVRLTTPSRGLKILTPSANVKICGSESEPAVENYLRGIVRRELRGFVYHGCVFRGRMNIPACGKVHAATLARRNTMTVGVAPFFNVVDGSLQLPFNQACMSEPSQLDL